MTAISAPVIRVDGRSKVTGNAKYAAEFDAPNLAHAVLVTSTIGNGRITKMDTAKAAQAEGVVLVMTPGNAPRLPQNGPRPRGGRVLQLLQDNDVHYNNQPIAVVVANTFDQALYAASLVQVQYETAPPQLDFEAGFPAARPGSHGHNPPNVSAGNAAAGLEQAEVKVDEVYRTPMETHNPMEPHATMAQWDGDKLTLHDSTQSISGVQSVVSHTLGIPEDNVRVVCLYTGGGFGCKGSVWSHVVLAAMAAKAAGRPVRLALERPQMFGPVGGRPETYQHIVLGAKKDGTLTAIQHECYSHTSVIEDFTEPCTAPTRMLYASPNIDTSQKIVPLNVGTPTYQRAPGEAPGTFALEIAMDELAYKLNMDPVEMRLKNYAQVDPTSSKPFSSKHLKECYSQGAERFGWAKRNPQPRSVRAGRELIGWGMATATYPANRSGASARVTFQPNGRVRVASGSQDLGTGTYTIMAQVAAATLHLPIEKVDAVLGDTTLPRAPGSGGSTSAASVCPAVQAAAQQAQLKLLALATNDARSPFHGGRPEDLKFENGTIYHKDRPGDPMLFAALLVRTGGQPIAALASAEPEQEIHQYSTHSWGAVFAEVGVDEQLGVPRVHRVTAVYDVGTLLSGKTGKSQLSGGIVWGISLALYEKTYIDLATARPVNNNLAEYHVPVNADIGEIDVSVVGIPDDRVDPLGARGIGEIGITGAAAAVANAIFHATGKRIRQAPITPDLLMA
jgi:xanthine dehydrogenase YagR molybdenum-binding subunit